MLKLETMPIRGMVFFFSITQKFLYYDFLMLRLKVAACHFFISLIIIASLVLWATHVWYPDYTRTQGFMNILWILAGVDITLGPLLTAIVFDSRKKSLKFDLGVIILLQLSALIYGATTLFIARPVFIVFNVDRLTVVSAVDIPEQELEKAPPRYQDFSCSGPLLVGARLPRNPEESDRLLSLALRDHIDLPQLPQYYEPYEKLATEVKSRLRSLEALVERKPATKAEIDSGLSALKVAMTDVGFLPVTAIKPQQDAIAIIRRDDATVLGYLPIDAW